MEPIRDALRLAVAGLLFGMAAPADASRLALDLAGHVTGSVSGSPAPGESFRLELSLAEELPLPFFQTQLITNDAIRIRLVLPDDKYRYDDGVWFHPRIFVIDAETGDAVPPEDVTPGDPNLRLRVTLEFEAFENRGGGRPPDTVWAHLELLYPMDSWPSDVLGDEDAFLRALQTGDVELRKGGETVMTGTLVPEPRSALLLGFGLASLAATDRRRRL